MRRGRTMAAMLSAAVCMQSARADTVAPAPKGSAKPQARFALVIGSNTASDTSLAPLKYADDDAARYQELFRSLGARTYVLTRADDNTRRLHPQAIAESALPTRTSLDAALRALRTDLDKAAQEGVESTLYFVFAGHGSVRDGRGAVYLEDAALTGPDLDAALGALPAAHVHVIVDACASYYLAYGRGAGGTHRPIEGLRTGALVDDPRVGFLLSTSSARESHEWEAFEGGVFSHELRSGLYGAADADGDGSVSYREISAFVARANAGVPNERYRPDMYARAPKDSSELANLRVGQSRKLSFGAQHSGHYFLESAEGVRLLDVNNAPGQALSLNLPRLPGPMYLRRADMSEEYRVDGAGDEVPLAMLTPQVPSERTRGAAHASFEKLFSLGFGADFVAHYTYEPLPPPSVGNADLGPEPMKRLSTKRAIGWGAVAGGGITLLISGITWASAPRAAELNAWASQREAADFKQSIESANRTTVALAIGGSAIALTGATLLLWPEGPALKASAGPRGASLSYGGTF